MNTVERNELLMALYQVSSKQDILKQFESKLLGAKGTNAQRYTYLLEQILFYSHAIIFGHGVQTAHNYRQSFMTMAKKSKSLKMSAKEIEKAFSFLNRTEKKRVTKEPQTKKQIEPNKEALKVDNSCVAKDEIRRLKEQLDSKSYELSKGQKEDDKEAFIKISLVALSTGARLKDIMEDLTISTKNRVVFFDNGIKKKEGLILELDTKTVQGYIKAIRSHYKDRIGKVDISTGIRKAIKRLNIPNCGNTNHLNAIYRQCLTSSESK